MTAAVRIFFGPPGTGKTATLLRCVRGELDRGVAPERIALVAFSRRAAGEARARGQAELGIAPDDIPWWRTLHSAAARELGAGGQLVDAPHWEALGRALGMEFAPLDEDGRPTGFRRELGHRVQRIYYLRRSRQASLDWDDLVKALGHDAAWHVKRFEKTLAAYKAARGLRDYADLLDDAPGALGAEVVLLDEAQDLTAQQWAYFDRIRAGADRVYVAGDDDQAVFGWAGADVERFLSLEGEREVLDLSHRVPRAVREVAARVGSRIRRRVPKEWRPDAREGLVERACSLDQLDLGRGTWLLLARTRRGLDALEEACRAASVRYSRSGADSVREAEVAAIRAWERGRRGASVDEPAAALAGGARPDRGSPIWHEALVGIPLARRRYYEAVLRARGQDELSQPPRVRIDTIHGAKGAEADHVALLIDTTPQVERGMRADPDAEHRVWYVALTRCRESLHLLRPEGDLYYRVPA